MSHYGVARCLEYLDSADKYATVNQMFGEHLSVDQLKVICDELYMIESKKTVSCLDSSGQWALFRHKRNERGDTSSKVRRK
eukprot:1154049-Heterocapsa_arctica.AAC.1